MALVAERTLDCQPDATAWCPVDGLRNLLAVGTYELQEATNTRDGRCTTDPPALPNTASPFLLLWTVSFNLRAYDRLPSPDRLYIFDAGPCIDAVASRTDCTHDLGSPIAQLDTRGILDVEWSRGQEALLALALSDGRVTVLNVERPAACAAADMPSSEFDLGSGGPPQQLGVHSRQHGSNLMSTKSSCEVQSVHEQLDPGGQGLLITELSSACACHNSLALSLDWNRGASDCAATQLAVSAADGGVAAYQVPIRQNLGDQIVHNSYTSLQ